jgi:hypothetical protein
MRGFFLLPPKPENSKPKSGVTMAHFNSTRSAARDINAGHANSARSRNIDLIAIGIGLTLAVLIRFNILPSIPF